MPLGHERHPLQRFHQLRLGERQALRHGEKGWVSNFVANLESLLAPELPRGLTHLRYWLDYEEMRGNNPISATIRAKVRVSELLVPFISKAWRDSPWRQDELQTFIDEYGRNSGRVFPVWMEPVEGLPPGIEGLLKYKSGTTT